MRQSRPQVSALTQDDTALGSSPAITTAKGDPIFDALMGNRRFESWAVKPAKGRVPRPDPVGVSGGGSSLSVNPGSNGRQGVAYRGHR